MKLIKWIQSRIARDMRANSMRKLSLISKMNRRALTVAITAIAWCGLISQVAWGEVTPVKVSGTSNEWYVRFTSNDSWTAPANSSNFRVLIVGGGGGGGKAIGGGGGAGEFYEGSANLTAGQAYTITVGAGGAGGSGASNGGQSHGKNGGDSEIKASSTSTIVIHAKGGGGGGSAWKYNNNSLSAGNAGGSGGGGSYSAGTGGGASKYNTSGFANEGVDFYTESSNNYGGGGGGAGSAGSKKDGGAGKTSQYASGTFACGGGGGTGASTGAGSSPQSGNYGNGGAFEKSGQNAQANTGSGGGGSGGINTDNNYVGGNGGSGIVVIRYTISTPTPTGITATTNTANNVTTVKFTGAGTLNNWQVPANASNFRVLLVGGGGGGGAGLGGGGGAGEFYDSLATQSTLLTANQTYTITVGAGGASGANGGDSSILGSGLTLTVKGGGAGGTGSGTSVGIAGGSGGGGAGYKDGVTTISGGSKNGSYSGSAGGSGSWTASTGLGFAGGGGGASGTAGGNATTSQAGSGAAGAQSDITGENKYYAAGGGGGTNQEQAKRGAGGSDIGGTGGYLGSTGTTGVDGGNAVANTGSGGGGGGGGKNGGNGADGIVVIQYTIQTHTHSYTGVVTTPATCTTKGVMTYTCTCGDSYPGEIAINPNNHNWGEWVVSGNVKTRTCTRCSAQETQSLTGLTTNAMSNASWGYEIHGLGTSGNEVALVYTNQNNNSMTFTAPSGVNSIELLLVGGGGSGQASNAGSGGGGGGGGGVRHVSSVSVTSGTDYTIVVGKGGNAVSTSVGTGTEGLSGTQSSFGSSYTIVGGNGGANLDGGLSGNGFTGGGDYPGEYPNRHYNGGGGAGAGANGNAGTASKGGNGGAGVECSITGVSVRYGGGGGGGGGEGEGGEGDNKGEGVDGGGDGCVGRYYPNGTDTYGKVANGSGQKGTDGLGGGGGGARFDNVGVAMSGAGGSGVVIIRFSTTAVCAHPSQRLFVVTAPTATAAGTAACVCTICGQEVEVTIPANTPVWDPREQEHLAAYMNDPDIYSHAQHGGDLRNSYDRCRPKTGGTSDYYNLYLGEYVADANAPFYVTNAAPRVLSVPLGDGTYAASAHDLGGWPLIGGGATKQGVFFRSGSMDALKNNPSASVLSSVLGIKTEIDLRGSDEASAVRVNNGQAAKIDSNLKYYNYPFDTTGQSGWKNLSSANCKSSVKNVFALFADAASRPAIFHCTVGRDRTGLIAQLLMQLVGCTEESLYRDYLLSWFANGLSDGQTPDSVDKRLVWFYQMGDDTLRLTGTDGSSLAALTGEYLKECGVTAAQLDAVCQAFVGETYAQVLSRVSTAETSLGVQKVVYVNDQVYANRPNSLTLTNIIRRVAVSGSNYGYAEGGLYTTNNVGYGEGTYEWVDSIEGNTLVRTWTGSAVSGFYDWNNSEGGSWGEKTNWRPADTPSGLILPHLEDDYVRFRRNELFTKAVTVTLGADYYIGGMTNSLGNKEGTTLYPLTIDGQGQHILKVKNDIFASNKQTSIFKDITLDGSGTSSILISTASSSIATNMFVGSCVIESGIRLYRQGTNPYVVFLDGHTIIKSDVVGNDSGTYYWVIDNATVAAQNYDSTAGKLDLNVKLGANNNTTTLALSFSDNLTLKSDSALTIDATGKSAGTYPILRVGGTWDGAGKVAFVSNATITKPDSMTATLVEEAGLLSLVLTPSAGYDLSKVTATIQNTAIVYTGSAVTPAVTVVDTATGVTLKEGVHYTVSYANNTDVGEATATITAQAPTHGGPLNLAFTISPVANGWRVAPSVSDYLVGGTPSVTGEALHGTRTISYAGINGTTYGPSESAPPAEGSYCATFTVAPSEGYAGLTEEVLFYVVSEIVAPRQSAYLNEFIWKGGAANWATENWYIFNGQTANWPNAAAHVAIFPETLMGAAAANLNGGAYTVSALTNLATRQVTVLGPGSVTGGNFYLGDDSTLWVKDGATLSFLASGSGRRLMGDRATIVADGKGTCVTVGGSANSAASEYCFKGLNQTLTAINGATLIVTNSAYGSQYSAPTDRANDAHQVNYYQDLDGLTYLASGEGSHVHVGISCQGNDRFGFMAGQNITFKVEDGGLMTFGNRLSRTGICFNHTRSVNLIVDGGTMESYGYMQLCSCEYLTGAGDNRHTLEFCGHNPVFRLNKTDLTAVGITGDTDTRGYITMGKNKRACETTLRFRPTLEWDRTIGRLQTEGSVTVNDGADNFIAYEIDLSEIPELPLNEEDEVRIPLISSYINEREGSTTPVCIPPMVRFTGDHIGYKASLERVNYNNDVVLVLSRCRALDRIELTAASGVYSGLSQENLIQVAKVYNTYGEEVESTYYNITKSANGTDYKHVGKITVTVTANAAAVSLGYEEGETIQTTYEITPAPLTLTVEDKTTTTQASAIPALTYSLTGWVNGETTSRFSTQPVLSTTCTSVKTPGAYAINATPGMFPAAQEDYKVTVVPGTLTVNEENVATKPTLKTAKGTYKGLAHKDQVVPATLSESDMFTYSWEGDWTSVGKHTVTATLKDTSTTHWADADNTTKPVVLTYEITPAPLTATPASVTLGYGDPVPTFTINYEGFKNGETAATVVQTAPVASTTYTVGALANTTHTITLSGGAVSSNYKLVLNEGSLKVTLKRLNIPAPGPKEETVTYNGTVWDFATVFGYPPGSLVVAGGLSGEPRDVGEYTASLEPAANYCWKDGTDNPVTGFVLTIEPATVNIPTAIDNLVYNGTAQTGVENIPDSTIATQSGDAVEQTNAGSYNTVYTLNDTTNYKWADDTTGSQTIDWLIAKKELTTSDVYLASPTSIYWDNTSHMPAFGGSAVLGTDFEYGFGDGATSKPPTSWGTDASKKAVSTAYVYVRAKADSVNYMNPDSDYLYLGTFKISRNSFYWDKAISGAWSNQGLDIGWTNKATYAQVPRSSDTAYIRKEGVSIDLGSADRAVYSLNVQENAKLFSSGTTRTLTTYNEIALAEGKTFTISNVTLKGYSATKYLNPKTNSTLVVAGKVTAKTLFGIHLKDQTGTTVRFENGTHDINTITASYTLSPTRNSNAVVFDNAIVAGTNICYFADKEVTVKSVNVTSNMTSIALSFKLGALNTTASDPMVKLVGRMSLNEGSSLAVDARGKTEGEYKLMDVAEFYNYAVDFASVVPQVDEDYTAELVATVNGVSKTLAEISNTGSTELSNFQLSLIIREKIAKPTAITGLTYDGTEQTGVADGTGYTLTNHKATNAGDYTATATLNDYYCWADDGSTTTVSINWSIAKKSITPTVTLSKTMATYGDSEWNTLPTVTVEDGTTELASSDYTSSWSSDTVTGANTYIVTVSASDNGNYTFSQVEKTYTVSPASVTVPTAKTGLEYTGKSQSGINNIPDDAIAEHTGDSSNKKGAGSYTTHYTLKDTTNYKWADGTIEKKTVKWSISKVSLTVAPVLSKTTIKLGEEAPTVTSLSYSGFVNGETQGTANIFTPPTYSTTYTPGAGASTYTYTLSGGSARDYTFNLQTAPFTVESDTYTITVSGGEGGTVGAAESYESSSTSSQTKQVTTAPTRANYKVIGYTVEGANFTTGNSGTVTVTPEGVITLPKGVYGNLTVTPIWQRVVLGFFFNPNDGKLPNSGKDNARIIPQGDCMRHNANISPIDPSAFVIIKNGTSETYLPNSDGLFEIVWDNTVAGNRYARFRMKTLDCFVYDSTYALFVDVKRVTTFTSTCYLKNEVNNTQTNQVAGAEALMQYDTALEEKVYRVERTSRPSTESGDVKSFMNEFFRIQGNTKVDFAFYQSVFAGTAVTADNYQYVTPFDGYISCNLPTPTRTGYTFKGWNTAENGTGTTVDDTTIADGTNLGTEGATTTLYAQWDKIIDMPTPNALTYNGEEQSVSFTEPNITIGGTTKATNAGTYTATVTPAEGYCWSDGSTDPKNVQWTIAKAPLTITLPDMITKPVVAEGAPTDEVKHYILDHIEYSGFVDGESEATVSPTTEGELDLGGYTEELKIDFASKLKADGSTELTNITATVTNTFTSPIYENYKVTEETLTAEMRIRPGFYTWNGAATGAWNDPNNWTTLEMPEGYNLSRGYPDNMGARVYVTNMPPETKTVTITIPRMDGRDLGHDFDVGQIYCAGEKNTNDRTLILTGEGTLRASVQLMSVGTICFDNTSGNNLYGTPVVYTCPPCGASITNKMGYTSCNMHIGGWYQTGSVEPKIQFKGLTASPFEGFINARSDKGYAYAIFNDCDIIRPISQTATNNANYWLKEDLNTQPYANYLFRVQGSSDNLYLAMTNSALYETTLPDNTTYGNYIGKKGVVELSKSSLHLDLLKSGTKAQEVFRGTFILDDSVFEAEHGPATVTNLTLTGANSLMRNNAGTINLDGPMAITYPASGFTNGAPIVAANVTLTANAKFIIDATAIIADGTYPIVEATSEMSDASTLEPIVTLNPGCAFVWRIETTDKTINLVLERRYRVFQAGSADAATVHIPEAFLTAAGIALPTDETTRAAAFAALNTKNAKGVSPMEAYLMGFEAEDVPSVNPVLVQEGATLKLMNGSSAWPTTAALPDRTDLNYELKRAGTPTSESWSQIGETGLKGTTPVFTLPDFDTETSATEPAKYYKVFMNITVQDDGVHVQ